MKEFEIIDNCLDDLNFKIIQKNIINVPWYVSENISGNSIEKDCYFIHLFYSQLIKSSWFDILLPLFEVLDIKSLIRVKGNLYPRTETVIHHTNHVDYDFPHKAAIFYLNTCDGFTVIDDEHYIESVENRLLLFDPQITHHSTNCTNTQFRANINFNYF